MPYIEPPEAQDGEDYKLELYYKQMEQEAPTLEEDIARLEAIKEKTWFDEMMLDSFVGLKKLTIRKESPCQ